MNGFRAETVALSHKASERRTPMPLWPLTAHSPGTLQDLDTRDHNSCYGCDYCAMRCTLTCDVCPEVFTLIARLEQHREAAHELTRYACPYDEDCQRNFNLLYRLQAIRTCPSKDTARHFNGNFKSMQRGLGLPRSGELGLAPTST